MVTSLIIQLGSFNGYVVISCIMQVILPASCVWPIKCW